MAVDDAYSKALLHFEGADESTTITDESGKVWTAHNSAQIDTAQYKIGTASLLINLVSPPDWIDTPDHADFDLGTGDFTVDFWARLATNSGQRVFWAISNDADMARMVFDYYSGSLRFQVVSSSESVLLDVSKAATVNVDTWYHVALVRSGDDFKIFLDGTQCGATVTQSITLPDYDAGPKIGLESNWSSKYDGWIDEFRWSKGKARWTGNFTPKTTPYIPGSLIEAEPLSLISAIIADTNFASVTAPPFELTSSLSSIIPIDITAPPFSLTSSMLATIPRSFSAPPFTITSSLLAGVHVASYFSEELPALTCAAEGAVRSGTLIETLPGLTISATGLTGAIGGLTKALPQFALIAYGGGYAVLTGPVLTVAATGLTGVVGSLLKSFPLLTLSATGKGETLGTLAVTLPKLTLAANGFNNGLGSLSLSLPIFNIEGHGLSGTVGQLSKSLPRFALSGSGWENGKGTLSVTLPAFYVDAHGELVQATVIYKVVAVNPKNFAVSEYESFPFNSFAYFNGQYLAAKSTGIHILTGDKDNGSNVAAEIKSAALAMGSTKARNIWVSGRSDGDMTVTITADEDTAKEVSVDYLLEDLGQDRAKVPRGMDPVYLQVGLKNSNGADFDIDSIQILGEGLKRKRK